MSKTFSEFKKGFYSKVPDLTIFDCEDYNLLKVVLDGLKVDYKKRGVLDQDIYKPSILNRLLLVARRIKHFKSIRSAREKCKKVSAGLIVPYLFFDNGRTAVDEAGNKVSFYFN